MTSPTPEQKARGLEEMERAFEYLDDLRESGAINMFGARPYLAREMGIPPKEAGAILSAWMKTYDGKTSAADRAAALRTKKDHPDD